MGGKEVEAFLSHLATHGNVSSSIQYQEKLLYFLLRADVSVLNVV
jgi:hypothetical protein